MRLEELKDKLFQNNVPDRWYSINDGLKPGAFILYKNYSIWECFYLDEKGERLDINVFTNDVDAYDYLWKNLKEQLKTFRIRPRGM
jgi:hypothetical protein